MSFKFDVDEDPDALPLPPTRRRWTFLNTDSEPMTIEVERVRTIATRAGVVASVIWFCVLLLGMLFATPGWIVGLVALVSLFLGIGVGAAFIVIMRPDILARHLLPGEQSEYSPPRHPTPPGTTVKAE